MGKQCLKCGYERQANDLAPEYECPKCGAIYSKVEAALRRDKGVVSDTNINLNSSASPTVVYGILLLALPVISTLLIWFWIGSMNMLQSPGQALAMVGVFTIAGTALIAAIEASQVGMVSDRKKGTYSPLAWFFIVLLIWIIGYPAYLYKRRKYGLTNFLLIGMVVAIVFVGSQFLMGLAIDKRIEEVRGTLGQFSLEDTEKNVTDSQERIPESKFATANVAGVSQAVPDLASTALAENWQNPWSSEKGSAAQRCAKTFDNFQMQAVCMQNEQNGYNKMQSNFGLPSSVAQQAKVRCARTFDDFQMQAVCMQNEKNGYDKMQAN